MSDRVYLVCAECGLGFSVSDRDDVPDCPGCGSGKVSKTDEPVPQGYSSINLDGLE